MELKLIQNKVDDWISKHGVRYFDPLTNLAQLTEEVGEVAAKVSGCEPLLRDFRSRSVCEPATVPSASRSDDPEPGF